MTGCYMLCAQIICQMRGHDSCHHVLYYNILCFIWTLAIEIGMNNLRAQNEYNKFIFSAITVEYNSNRYYLSQNLTHITQNFCIEILELSDVSTMFSNGRVLFIIFISTILTFSIHDSTVSNLSMNIDTAYYLKKYIALF